MFVEQYNGVGWLYLFEDQFALGRLLLVFREALGILQLGDDRQLEGHVMADAIDIIADACLEMLVGGLAYQNEDGLHIWLPDRFLFEEFFKLTLVAVEHIDVYIAVNACHAAVGTELPEG